MNSNAIAFVPPALPRLDAMPSMSAASPPASRASPFDSLPDELIEAIGERVFDEYMWASDCDRASLHAFSKAARRMWTILEPLRWRYLDIRAGRYKLDRLRELLAKKGRHVARVRLSLPSYDTSVVTLSAECLRQCDSLSRLDLTVRGWDSGNVWSSDQLPKLWAAVRDSAAHLQVLKLRQAAGNLRFPNPDFAALLRHCAAIRILELDCMIGSDSGGAPSSHTTDPEVSVALAHLSSLRLARLSLTGSPALGNQSIPHWPHLAHLHLTVDNVRGTAQLSRLLESVSSTLRTLSLHIDLETAQHLSQIVPINFAKLDTLRLGTSHAKTSFRKLVHPATPLTYVCLDAASTQDLAEILDFRRSQPIKTLSRILILRATTGQVHSPAIWSSATPQHMAMFKTKAEQIGMLVTEVDRTAYEEEIERRAWAGAIGALVLSA